MHKRANLVLALLTAINLVNYLDRYILAPALPAIERELHINHTQSGLLVSAFFVVYMVASIPIGLLADRTTRKYLIAAGILIWSFATLMSGAAHSYTTLRAARGLVGIGEASYACIVPALLGDLFPAQKRSRALSIFYAAIPVGAALGYALGGWILREHSWRTVFYVGAVPGFFLSIAMALTPEPRRGAADEIHGGIGQAVEHHSTTNPKSGASWFEAIRELRSNGAFATATLGMAFSTFALGALAYWVPSFLVQVRRLPSDRANYIFGGITLFNGVVATVLGGWLADRLLRTNIRANFQVSAWSMLIGTPFALLSIYVATPSGLLPAMFAAEFFLFLSGGPMNAAIVNSVPARIRATSMAINLIVIHVLGDVPSPPLVGYIADRTHNLALGLTAILPAMVISAAFLFYGQRFAAAHTH